MVRRVGFVDKLDEGQKKSTADQYLDEFRAKKQNKHPADDAATATKPKRQWVAIIFLAVWLVLWTVGMMMVGLQILNGAEDGFLVVWLLGASIGWLFAVYMLVRLWRGTL